MGKKMSITTATIISIGISITYLLIAAAAAAAAAAGPPPQLDCFPYLAEAGDCLNFVANGSELRKPGRKCCREVANLTETHPICLCQLLSNSSQFGFSLDTNNAFQLPSLCNLSTFPNPITLCAGAPLPIPSPSPPKAPGNKDNASLTTGVVPYNQHFVIGLLLILYMSIIY